MKVSIIITTYNAEEWLRKVLIGFSVQSVDDFEIVIADDGSTQKTKEVVDSFLSKFKHPIVHVWHEDDGFQKSKILNQAILKSSSDYLLFTDGDCIPRNDFIATHLLHKEEGYFLSGGYFKLPMSISNAISEIDIVSQNCFDSSWLRKQGLKFNFKLTKLTKNKWFAAFMNWLTPTKRSWNGHNSSGFKKDILAVNGFNEDMKYGGLDRELGERMFNNGMLSKQIRYSAICLHLDHKRSYATKESISRNQAIRKFNKKNKITWIPKGIKKMNKLNSMNSDSHI
ncbi:MAG TPA: glycosyltransferase family 2 protein [Flavobacterium sp.]|uniref:glycosyltransferase family 2 protein n=1 Tax=unclassified Flavobacterium TaxID=196869 RepID=UPI000E80A70D|nr:MULTISPECIES: glycosyltransferase family 2 protein [unclassified Flavobacterium]HBI00963.1 glycosyl transferase family 2 [Flavobacterium sp.]HRE77215.1 glycosyltransferase family 2 protein [Flavobacterium sp.]